MAKIKSDRPVVPSLLDRLIDQRPDQKREPAKAQSQVLEEMRQSVRRDLENLLNTRVRCTSCPEDLTELEYSLVTYGIPDITAIDLNSYSERRQFLHRVQRMIEYFEPRFMSIRVVPLDNADYYDRTLRFRIEAEMYAYPAPEAVVFDSVLEPRTGNFSTIDRS